MMRGARRQSIVKTQSRPFAASSALLHLRDQITAVNEFTPSRVRAMPLMEALLTHPPGDGRHLKISMATLVHVGRGSLETKQAFLFASISTGSNADHGVVSAAPSSSPSDIPWLFWIALGPSW